MEFTKDISTTTYQIQTYKDKCVVINGQTYTDSVIVMPDHLIAPWGPKALASLKPSDFEVLLPYKPQVVLLGTGARLQFPPHSLYAVLTEHKIGVEVMDTAAACRTYTILVTEGRQVAAALLI